jgi:predicted  nucleic acid-binding Zn-ribbon protein
MTTNESAPTNQSRTLAQRLAQGRIPAPEAGRYAMILAEALRKIHDAGQVHGGVSPASIVLTGSGLELCPAPHMEGTVTPYTAPELLQGCAADSRSDLFAFGAVVYEMFTGRRAFEGDGKAALSAAINTSMPPSCGSPAVDRLIRNCLAKDPGTRWQRMHKVLMELKLLSVSARRVEVPAAVRREPGEDAGLRAQMQQLEARVAARLEACEKTVTEIRYAATETLNTLRGQLAAVNAQIAAAGERQVAIPEGFLEAAEQRIAARLGRGIETAGERITRVEHGQESFGERIARLEQGLDAARQHAATLHDSVAEDFLAFEQGLKSQAATIESARTAMAQTDDLVERVVEALESLQSAVLGQQDRAVAMN